MNVSALERSYRDENMVELAPRHLLCLRCLHGGGRLDFMDQCGLPAVLDRLRKQPATYIRLTGAFDEIGARTASYGEQTPAERRADLIVLQKLDLVPGSVRFAPWLFNQIEEAFPDIGTVCARREGACGAWAACPNARCDFYTRGRDLLPARDPDEKHAYKLASCADIGRGQRLALRAHHLLCMTCFAGREPFEVIEEDNLHEAIMKIAENPDIPVEVVEGTGKCQICPPCYGYDTKNGHCIAPCGLRDRSKDLEVFYLLGLSPGDVLPGAELLRRIYACIDSTAGICDWGDDVIYEWRACGDARTDSFARGRARILGYLDGK